MSQPSSLLPLTTSLRILAGYTISRITWTRRTLILAVLVLIPGLLGVIIRTEAPPGTSEEFVTAGLPSVLLVITQLICVFHGAGLVRDGLEDHTLDFMLTRPIGRSRVVFGLFLGLLMFVIPFVFIAIVVGYGAFTAGGDGLLGFLSDDRLWMLVSVGLLATVFYSAFYTWLGLKFRYPAVLGVLFLVIVEGVMGSLPGKPRRIAPSAWLEYILEPTFATRARLEQAASRFSNIASEEMISGTTSVIVLTVGFLLLLLLIYWEARRADFHSRTVPKS